MDTIVTTRTLTPSRYLLTVKHETDDNSFISHILKLEEGEGGEGETIYTSYPKETPEEAEKAAMDYFAQLRK
ncbi:hypothetical protein N6H14_02540 [Paenibacillus sp. CC-CFT747]|nr:hypothetical protein N6H14_02540 [Paenibacillus sp. CC-CFT747]